MPTLSRFSAVALVFALAAAVPARAAQVSTRRTRTVLAVERVKDAVVHIATEQLVRSRNHDATDDAYERFYREQDDSGREDALHPLGSGTLIDPSGFIITSYRVVSRGSRLHVSLDQGKDYAARVVGTDPDSDIAILRIDGSGFPFAAMGTSDDLMIGEAAIALGNPFAQSRTAAVGVVSATNRTVHTDGRTYHDLVQTDAAIDPGNAGGPLVNGDGEIMGVVTSIGSDGRIGYGVPIERAKKIALELIKTGDASQAFLGFDVQTVNEEIARSLGVTAKRGASIVALEAKSPAEFAGLKVGDVITAVQKQQVRDAGELFYALRDVSVGKQAVLEVSRGQEKRNVTVTAAEFPLERAEALFARKLGAAVTELNGTSARRMDMSSETAVAVRVVTRGSPAEKAGLAPGDVIRAVNSLEINKLQDFRVAVARARRCGSAVLLVQRGFQLEQIPFDFY